MIFAVFWIRIRTFDSGSGSGQDSQTYADPDPQHGVQTFYSHLLVPLSSLSLRQGPPSGLPRTAPRLRLTGCLRRFLHSPLHPVWARPGLKAVRENLKEISSNYAWLHPYPHVSVHTLYFLLSPVLSQRGAGGGGWGGGGRGGQSCLPISSVVCQPVTLTPLVGFPAASQSLLCLSVSPSRKTRMLLSSIFLLSLSLRHRSLLSPRLSVSLL